MSRVTIAEVARMAGVSPTAVPFTFNHPSELSPETVRRVLAVAEELGYAPNPHARALLSSRVGVIGVLVEENISDAFANPFYAPFVRGVGSVCDEMNLSLMIVSVSASPKRACQPVSPLRLSACQQKQRPMARPAEGMESSPELHRG